MCIICVKPADVKFPTYQTIQTMFFRNPDGAGYMYNDNGKVVIHKGFMTFDEFDTNIFLQKTMNDLEKKTVIMHFRIGTHGGNTEGNTHPFPLSDSFKVMKKVDQTTKLGIVHNGIIRINPSRSDVSDTMEFIKSGLHPMSQVEPDWYLNEKILRMIERYINGSRMAFLDGNGNWTTCGNWIEGDDGCLYSNRSYTYGARK